MSIETDIDLEPEGRLEFHADGRIDFLRYIGAAREGIYGGEHIESLPERIQGFDMEMQRLIRQGLNLVAAKKTMAVEEITTIKQDAKALYSLHVTPIIQEAKKGFQDKNAVEKVSTALEVTGRLWNGVSKFWHALASRHKVLEQANNFVIKPVAISLYASFLPEIGLIKACEFVGRSVKAYRKGDKGKKWGAVITVAKEMGKEIVQHFKRLTGDSLTQKTVSKLTDAALAGTDQEHVKAIINLLSLPSIAEKLEDKLVNPAVAAEALIAVGEDKIKDATKEQKEELIDRLKKVITSEKVDLAGFLEESKKHMSDKLLGKLKQEIGEKTGLDLPKLEEHLKQTDLLKDASKDILKLSDQLFGKFEKEIGEKTELTLPELEKHLKQSKLFDGASKADILKYATRHLVEKSMKNEVVKKVVAAVRPIVGANTELVLSKSDSRPRSHTI